MPLDAADFIAELDITSPPGTDPLNQGDDQIRTAKRTQLNSFPLIGGAVSIDHNQMNQMAIKNEVNTFTQTNRFDANQEIVERLRFIRNGASGFPQLSYADENDVSVWDVYMDNRAGFENALRIDRRVAGVLQDTPITIKSNGFINFDTAAGAFFGQSLRLETAINTPSTSVQTGMLFIGGSATLRWSLSRQADDVTGDLVFNRHDGNGTLQDTVFRLAQADGVATFADRIDLTGGNVRFNNFARADGLQWRHNGQTTWEINAVHSVSPLLRLVFNRYIAGVFQDAPMEMENDTGHILMRNLPTTNPGGSGILWKSSGFIAIT